MFGGIAEESSIDQQLFYNGKSLRNDETLASYSVKYGTVLHLSPSSFKIIIETKTSSVTSLYVNQDDTIEVVKKLYIRKRGLMGKLFRVCVLYTVKMTLEITKLYQVMASSPMILNVRSFVSKLLSH